MMLSPESFPAVTDDSRADKTTDEKFMTRAVALAVRAHPYPNPRVGCVVVKDGK